MAGGADGTGQRNEDLMKNKTQPVTLSERELEILKLMAEGHTDKAISAKLKISEHTPGTHRAHIYRKLRVNNAMEAVRFAMRAGWIAI